MTRPSTLVSRGGAAISAFTPPGIRIVALRSGFGIEAGATYTVRGFVINRHWRTGEPDPHVLLEEVTFPPGMFGEIGYPRDGFRIPDLPGLALVRELETA